MDPHLVGRIDGEGDGFLQYYTKITILGVGAGGHGYLCSGGMGSSPHAVELEAVVDDTLPANFERCVWSVLPVDIWNTSARVRHWCARGGGGRGWLGLGRGWLCPTSDA